MKIKILLIYLLCFALNLNAQVITTFAGSSTSGSTPLGDGGPATAAYLPNPIRGVFDNEGNFYVPSAISGNRVRKIDVFGNITTVAGTGSSGYNGDGIPATNAKLNLPSSIILDTAGNLYICESNGARIRKVDKATGLISTFAGTGIISAGPDGVMATASALNDPVDIKFDRHGNLYVSEYFSNKIRKIAPSGIITTFAGNGISGYSGDGSRADTSRLGGVGEIYLDTIGNLYIADVGNSAIIKIDTGLIMTTLAGTHTGYLYNGDEIPATTANIDPYGVIGDDSGNFYIPEYHNYRVRKIDNLGIIHTVAGIGTSGNSGDNGPATSAQFNYPSVVRIDKCGNLYISDASNARVRKVWLAGMAATPVATITPLPDDTVCTGGMVSLTATVPAADTASNYQWYVNGVAISGATGAVYSYSPANGDTVNCKMTAVVACNGGFTITSNTVHLTTINAATPTITLNGVSTAAPGAAVTVTAIVGGAGGSYTIRWMNHGVVFATTTTPMTSYVKGAGEDTITARIVPTGNCYDSVTSAAHIITADHTGIATSVLQSIAVYPMPATDVLQVAGISEVVSYHITTVTGYTMVKGPLMPGEAISVKELPTGIYLLQLQAAKGDKAVIRLVKQ